MLRPIYNVPIPFFRITARLDVIWHSICRLSIGQIVTAIKRSITNGANCLFFGSTLTLPGSLNEREVTMAMIGRQLLYSSANIPTIDSVPNGVAGLVV